MTRPRTPSSWLCSAFTWTILSAICWNRRAGRTSICQRSLSPNSASRSAQGAITCVGLATSCTPEREPREVLDEFKRSMGSLDFAAQYQQEAGRGGWQPHQMGLVSVLRYAAGPDTRRPDRRKLGYRHEQQGAFQLFGLRGAADQGRNRLGAGRSS